MDDQTRSSVAATTQRYAESVAAQLGTSMQVRLSHEGYNIGCGACCPGQAES